MAGTPVNCDRSAFDFDKSALDAVIEQFRARPGNAGAVYVVPNAVTMGPATVAKVLDDSPVFSGYFHASSGRTNVELKETATEHLFKVSALGLRKEDVQVQVEGGRMLTISKHHRKENVLVREKSHRNDRIEGQFLLKYRLPENANLDAVTARVSCWVLTVVVPKLNKNAHGPRTIGIDGSDEPAEVMQTEPSKQHSQAGPSKSSAQ